MLSNIHLRRYSMEELSYLKAIPIRVLRHYNLHPSLRYYIETHTFRDVNPRKPPEIPEHFIYTDGVDTTIVFTSLGIISSNLSATRPIPERITPTNISPIPERITPTNPSPILEETNEYQESHSDLDRKYSGCIFEHNNILYMVASFDRDHNMEVRRLNVRDYGRIPYSTDLFKLPKMGYVNTDTVTLFLERNYKRNDSRFKRGFHPYNCTITSISERELRNIGSNDYIINDNNIAIINKIGSQLFYRTFPNYKEAIEKLLNFEVLSIALSTSIAISLNSYYNKFVILKNKWIIGEFSIKKNKFILYNDLFTSDLDKLNVNYEVKNENQ